MAIRFKAVRVSINHNAFGLRKMFFFTDNGQAWSAAANDLNVVEQGGEFTIPSHRFPTSDEGNIATELIRKGFELVEKLQPDPPKELIDEVFPENSVIVPLAV